MFVFFYVGSARGVGAEAAALAGYSGDRHTLAQVAYENLRHPEIVAAIRARAQQILSEYDTAARLAEFIQSEPAPSERAAWVRAIELWFKYHVALDAKVQIEHTTRKQIEVREITFTTRDREQDPS
jgi:hypothetical protein